MPLTPLMKDRLVRRDELKEKDPAAKKSNEYNVRRYVQNYLKDLEEILWILDMLPENQLRRIFKNDEDVYNLLELVERALVFLDFMPVKEYKVSLDVPLGLVKEKALLAEDEDGNTRVFPSSYPATEQDIRRHHKIHEYINRLKKFIELRPGCLYKTSKLNHIYYSELIKDVIRKKYTPCVRPSALSDDVV